MHETVIDAHEMSNEVGENNEAAITYADTEDNQSELPEKSKAPIDEMNDKQSFILNSRHLTLVAF